MVLIVYLKIVNNIFMVVNDGWNVEVIMGVEVVLFILVWFFIVKKKYGVFMSFVIKINSFVWIVIYIVLIVISFKLLKISERFIFILMEVISM